MSSRRRTSDQDALETKLLQVCFLPPGAAVAVWDRELAGSLSIEDLPLDLHGVLPLLHRRLCELDRRTSYMDRLLGIRRRLWAQNELRLRGVCSAIERLEAQGVPTALFGGLAILAGHLGRTDLRPLHDADVLVRASDADRARDVLTHAGWRVESPWRGGFLLDMRGARCIDDQGQAVSLRWSESAAYADVLWHVVPAALGDISLTVASKEDLLMHTVLDGPRARWMADALILLLDPSETDWDRLSAAVRTRHGIASMRSALSQLERVVPLPLTTGVASLWPLPSAPERLLARPTVGRPTLLRAYARRSLGHGPVRALRGVPSYLCEVWDLPSSRSLPREAAKRAVHRAKRRLRRAR